LSSNTRSHIPQAHPTVQPVVVVYSARGESSASRRVGVSSQPVGTAGRGSLTPNHHSTRRNKKWTLVSQTSSIHSANTS